MNTSCNEYLIAPPGIETHSRPLPAIHRRIGGKRFIPRCYHTPLYLLALFLVPRANYTALYPARVRLVDTESQYGAAASVLSGYLVNAI